MTTRNASASARQQRRRLAQLLVMAGSSVALAVSWVGVVQADRDASSAAVAAVAPDAAAPVVAQPVARADGTTLVPAPAAVQRPVVIRRSRAS